MFSPIKMIVILDHEKVDITTNSSPIRLIVGGRAKLVRLAESHQVWLLVGGRFVGLGLELLFDYEFIHS